MSWSDAEARLAERLPGYEPRPQQRALATAIEDSLNAREVIFAQGACGVGKSLAGLVAAVDFALDNGVPVIISTATKSLQNQYSQKDIPFLQENLGRPFTATLLKGRGNYACRVRLQEAKEGDVRHLAELHTELAQEGHSGDLDDITTELVGAERARITMSSDECPGKRACPFGETCFAERAKTRAKAADLVIVNHATLISDLLIKKNDGHGILPNFDAVILDEAHELCSYATNALGAEFTQRGIKNLGAEVANLMGQTASSPVAALNVATDNLFAHLGALLGRERTVRFRDQELLDAEYVVIPFIDSLMALKDAIKGFSVHGDDGGALRQKRITKKVNSWIAKFQRIVLASSDELVRWVEGDDKRGTVLKFAPLHVGPFLKEMLWDRVPAVMMSATLAIGKDFSFAAEQHGVESYRQIDAGTPFDFARQARLLVPSNCDPSADQAGWRTKVQIAATELIKASEGRALLLFSSRSAMMALHALMADTLEDMGLRVLLQGEGTNRHLAEVFKSDETSVLFGLKSFATGFDPSGSTCRLVILDKMPFPVPTDVIFKARADAIDAKKTGWSDGSFTKLSVPSMALDLFQGFGRLIRTKEDEGLVAIMDSRLGSKGYGKKILGALPPATRVTDLADAKSYLTDLTARKGQEALDQIPANLLSDEKARKFAPVR